MNVPIISFEISRMQHTLRTMLSEHTAMLDRDLQAAVDRYCTEDHLKEVIWTQTKHCMDEVVTSEIRSFFGYSGRGNKLIRAAVLEHLDEIYPVE